MRCTTELTAHFALNMNLIGEKELDAFLNNDDEPGSIEYWEAFDRAEEARLRGEDGLLDALDFDTVPFESVVETLSLELFEQDAAEGREWEHGACECETCGLNDDWEDGLLTLIAGKFYCAHCKPAEPQIGMLQELFERRRQHDLNARITRANKWRAALAKAKELRPEMNWGKYDFDSRMFA